MHLKWVTHRKGGFLSILQPLDCAPTGSMQSLMSAHFTHGAITSSDTALKEQQKHCFVTNDSFP